MSFVNCSSELIIHARSRQARDAFKSKSTENCLPGLEAGIVRQRPRLSSSSSCRFCCVQIKFIFSSQLISILVQLRLDPSALMVRSFVCRF